MPVDAFPYSLDALAGGAVRVLYAPITEPVPDGLDDIFLQIDPYTPAGTWLDFGATAGAFQYDRNLTVSGFKIEQETTDLLEEPTDLVRQIHIDIAEIRPETLQIIENAPSITTVVAATGVSAAKTVGVGTITDLTAYRVCFVAQRKQQGIVTETGTGSPTRGRFLAYVAYRAVLTTDNAQMSFSKGNLASAPLTLKLFPEPGQPSGQDWGRWVDEQAGTLT